MHSLRFIHARILNILINRNILGEAGKISEKIFTFSDFNYIDVTIRDRDAWTHGKTLLDGLAIFTAGYKMDVGTGAGVFCPNGYNC